jgi:hypothetical protein
MKKKNIDMWLMILIEVIKKKRRSYLYLLRQERTAYFAFLSNEKKEVCLLMYHINVSWKEIKIFLRNMDYILSLLHQIDCIMSKTKSC